MKKLIVQFVTWNSEQYIPLLFDSLRKQTFINFVLHIWDNNSSDGIVAAIKNELKEENGKWKVEIGNNYIDVKIHEHDENIGFAGGHNKLLQQEDSEYVLWLNPDIYLMPDCLERMVEFLDNHTDAAGVAPRLMKWNFGRTQITQIETNATKKLKESFSDTIDSLGLKVFRNRRVIEMSTGEDWNTCKFANLQTSVLEVFGLAGTLPMWRRSSLEHVSFSDGTVLDELYGSYKEDVDLAFRLQSMGMKTYVLLDVVAYHSRASGGPGSMSDIAAAKNKKDSHSDWIRYHSYKNHLMTLYKNEYQRNFLLDFLWIEWYELKKFVWFLLFDRGVLKGLGEVWEIRKELRGKREEVKKIRKMSWQEMRKWWV